ncbi:MAG TPA: histidine phosphatase family protein [Chloroflexota bacterium]|nr:histidine phosphatase family protein [Chloroflexota bacterium]
MTTAPSAPSAPTVQIPRRHRLILIRHARSAPDPQRNPREWDLADEGHAAARRLAALGLLDRADAFYAGPEPKMVHTVEPAATSRDRQVRQEAAFAETHSAGWVGGDAEFQDTIQRFVEQPDQPAVPGWETAVAARERFSAGVERLRAEYEPNVNRDRVLPGTIVICTGGRMLTAYLSHLLGWTPADTFTRWQSLRMPDLAVLELHEDGQGHIVIPFGTLVV